MESPASATELFRHEIRAQIDKGFERCSFEGVPSPTCTEDRLVGAAVAHQHHPASAFGWIRVLTQDMMENGRMAQTDALP